MSSKTKNHDMVLEHDRQSTLTRPLVLAMNRREAATAMGISVRKLDELTKDREAKLPRLKIGSRVLYPVRELANWLSEQAEAETRRQCR